MTKTARLYIKCKHCGREITWREGRGWCHVFPGWTFPINAEQCNVHSADKSFTAEPPDDMIDDAKESKT